MNDNAHSCFRKALAKLSSALKHGLFKLISSCKPASRLHISHARRHVKNQAKHEGLQRIKESEQEVTPLLGNGNPTSNTHTTTTHTTSPTTSTTTTTSYRKDACVLRPLASGHWTPLKSRALVLCASPARRSLKPIAR
mgnify:CR=1 FL=1